MNRNSRDASAGRHLLLGAVLCLWMFSPSSAEACDLKCMIAELEKAVLAFKGAVEDLSGDVEQLGNDLEQSAGDTVEVFEQFGHSLSLVSAEALSVTGNAARTIHDGFEATRFLVEFEKKSYDRFVGSNGCSEDICEPFLAELAELFGKAASVYNATTRAVMSDLAATSHREFRLLMQINPAHVAEIQEKLTEEFPGPLLFPLYQAMSVMTAREPGAAALEGDAALRSVASINEILDRILELLASTEKAGAAHLRAVKAADASGASQDPTTRDLCWKWEGEIGNELANRHLVKGIFLRALGELLHFTGGFMEKAGLEAVDGVQLGADTGLAGAAVVKARPGRWGGHWLTGISEPLRAWGESIMWQIGACRSRMNQQVLLCVQREQGGSQKAGVVENCKDAVLNAWDEFPSPGFSVGGEHYDYLGF